jgi:hypothetical protein
MEVFVVKTGWWLLFEGAMTLAFSGGRGGF